ISASETPKSRLETRSFPPVSTPAPPPPPAAPLKPLKPLSNMSCCHLSGSCFGWGRRLKHRCLQRCTMFPGPPKSSFSSHKTGFQEGKLSIRVGIDQEKPLKMASYPLYERVDYQRPF
uniref:Uncharacterized protein n=1 Tax=Echeneis naucrates TaxID=173247 RepID=A0A665V5W6_ECHNA